MNMKSLSLLLFCLLLPIFCHGAHFYNKGSWYTFESDLFKIHYTKDAAFMVKTINNYATEAHKKLTPFYLFDPVETLGQKTHIVLVTSTDEANGGATPVPQNTIYLFLTMPPEGSILDNYYNYLKILVFHEYTHIVNLSSKRGYSKFLYNIFGNFIAPNLLQPLWMTEGFAVYSESYLTGHSNEGRLNSTLVDAMFRVSHCKNTVLPIDNLPNSGINWPVGNTPYLYGGKVMEYIASKHGSKAVGKKSYTMSGTLPYLINYAAENTFNQDYYSIYEEMLARDRMRYLKECGRIEGLGLTPSSKLTETGYYKNAIGNTDKGVLYSGYTVEDGSTLNLIKEDGSREKISEVSVYGANISSFKNLITFSAIHGDALQNDISKIHILDIESKKNKIFNFKNPDGSLLRLRDPFFSPDGKFITAVKLNPVRHSLVKITTKNKAPINMDLTTEDLSVENIFTFPYGFRLGAPKVSPDGSKLLFTIKTKIGSNAFYYDFTNRSITQLTNTNHTVLAPVWKNNLEILYSSDESGIYNLYDLNIETMKQKSQSNLLGAGINPLWSKNNLYYIGYNENGYDIYKRDKTPIISNFKQLGRPTLFVPKAELSTIKVDLADEEKVTNESEEYSSLINMRPRSWFPIIFSPDASNYQLGFFTFGADPLLQNSYTLIPIYDTKKNKLLYSLNLSNEAYRTHLILNLTENYYNYSLGRTRKKYSLTAYYPFSPREERIQNPFTNDTTGTYLNYSFIDDKYKKKSSYAAVGYKRNTRSKYAKSVTYESGSYLNLEYRNYNGSINSYYNAHSIRGLFKKYFHLFDHIVYAPSLYGTYFTGKKNYYVLGGVDLALTDMSPSLKPELPGYRQDSLRSSRYGSFNQELNFPLWSIYRGIGTLPYFLNKFSGSIGTHSAYLTDKGEKSKLYNSASLTLTKHFVIFYLSPLKLKIRVAKGFNNNGITAVSLYMVGDF